MADEPVAADNKAAEIAARRTRRRPAPEIDGQIAPGRSAVVSPTEPIPVESDTNRVEPEPALAARFSEPGDPAVPTNEPADAHVGERSGAETHAPTSSVSAPSRGRIALPLAIGLLVGAAAAVAGAYAIQALGFGTTLNGPRLDALMRRLDEADKKATAAGALAPRIDTLAKRLDALPPPAATDGLEKRLAAVEAAPAKGSGDTPPAQTDLGPITRRLDAVDGKLAALPSVSDVAARITAAAPPARNGADLAALTSKVDALASRIAPLETLAAPKTDVRAPQDRDTSAATQAGRGSDLAIVAADLVRRIAAGRPFGDDLTILATLGADAAKLARLKPLASSGVATAADLAAQFAPLAGAITAVGEPAHDEGFFAHLERSAGTLVRVQKVDGTDTGTDVAGRVARLQAALGRGDVPAAAGLWRGLPAAATAKAQGWGRAMEAHADALDAAQGLAGDAVALIGKGRS